MRAFRTKASNGKELPRKPFEPQEILLPQTGGQSLEGNLHVVYWPLLHNVPPSTVTLGMMLIQLYAIKYQQKITFHSVIVHGIIVWTNPGPMAVRY